MFVQRVARRRHFSATAEGQLLIPHLAEQGRAIYPKVVTVHPETLMTGRCLFGLKDLHLFQSMSPKK